ncbi:MAG TPA: hypothetical protein VFU71_00110 [Burkholderiaceae bacterium]|nr:hypothetical protein [Burkholderiaceae bacterium]
MPFGSLTQAYNVAPSRRDSARALAPLPARVVNPDGRARRERDARGDTGPERDAEGDRHHDCDSASRSPLMRALMLALQPVGSSARADAMLERALIAFARALNQATSDNDAAPQPAVARAGDAMQRRARNEDLLLVAFAELQHAAGRTGAPTREVLQVQLNAFLHTLARHLHVDDDRAGEATQPGSLISVYA